MKAKKFVDNGSGKIKVEEFNHVETNFPLLPPPTDLFREIEKIKNRLQKLEKK